MTARYNEKRGVGRRAAAWAELLRVSALFTVPGDALAGAAAARCGPNRGTALAACASLCLYEAGMALNDWADRDVDAIERPGRPLPSGRIAPAAALVAATGLTAAGLVCAAAAGRPALGTATVLAGTVWAYDLGLKNTPAGPPTMAAARALDLLLGATASAGASAGVSAGASAGVSDGASARVPDGAFAAGAVRSALPSAALLGAHTLAVTTVSRREAVGGSSAPPLAALATGAAIAWSVARRPAAHGRGARRRPSLLGRRAVTTAATETIRAAAMDRLAPHEPAARRHAVAHRTAAAATAALAATYTATAARPLAHAALNPSPYLLQSAVGGGIRAMIPLQAALASRAGAQRTALSLLALVPVARRLARKVSPT
ncbi:SCO3242 family prenyltransferase [Streptomyces sp. NPDC005322]|uniref:SCO3242 family prenyltransferase n=1 Tax=unclassified Streptomyces TaxID=2593676 RepID=UPI0033B37606